MAFRAQWKKKINITGVVSSIMITGFALMVGGYLLNALGDVVNGTTSPFNEGFSIIGWTVTNGQVTDTSTGGGILVIVGIVGFASVILQFVKFRF